MPIKYCLPNFFAYKIFINYLFKHVIVCTFTTRFIFMRINVTILITSILFVVSCAKNNKTDLLSDCDTSNVTYSKDITSILNSHCTGCHGGSSPQAGINLQGHANAKNFGASSLSSMKNGSMPKAAPKLDACLIAKFEKWVNDGMPNN